MYIYIYIYTFYDVANNRKKKKNVKPTWIMAAVIYYNSVEYDTCHGYVRCVECKRSIMAHAHYKYSGNNEIVSI